ncbi:VirB2 family type IV secretion system major pilin TrwL [Bartonella massiliensis]|uniref:VirB2 family type IV secretion system major pilin TrwL n=1 Tax=Bartonella massiliensis TaxID=929795 RepID=UPI001157EEA3|nr:VirB2 family type IV secretion system major pilin TrwL [Bartonella massiliensis]
MKTLNNLQSKSDNTIIAFFVTVTVSLITYPISVQAQDLTKAKNVLDKFKEQLDLIIPVAAAVILLCLAIGYAGRYIEKDTFVRWTIGVVIAGSALQIANMLFKP